METLFDGLELRPKTKKQRRNEAFMAALRFYNANRPDAPVFKNRIAFLKERNKEIYCMVVWDGEEYVPVSIHVIWAETHYEVIAPHRKTEIVRGPVFMC